MSIQINVSGPLFESGMEMMVQRAVHDIVENLMELGEQRLSEMLRMRPQGVYLSLAQARKGKASRGNYRRNVHGEMKSSTRAVIDDSKVIYGPWLEGTSSRNQTTRFKGYGAFRRTGQWLEGQVLDVAQTHSQNLVKRLG